MCTCIPVHVLSISLLPIICHHYIYYLYTYIPVHLYTCTYTPLPLAVSTPPCVITHHRHTQVYTRFLCVFAQEKATRSVWVSVVWVVGWDGGGGLSDTQVYRWYRRCNTVYTLCIHMYGCIHVHKVLFVCENLVGVVYLVLSTCVCWSQVGFWLQYGMKLFSCSRKAAG